MEFRINYEFARSNRRATAAEITGLVAESNRFFADQLTARYPGSFTSFGIANTVQTFDALAAILVDFDARVTFSTEDSSTPASAEIFLAMANFDYTSYIRNFVWESEPFYSSLLFDTETVFFGPSGQQARLAKGLALKGGAASQTSGSDPLQFISDTTTASEFPAVTTAPTNAHSKRPTPASIPQQWSVVAKEEEEDSFNFGGPEPHFTWFQWSESDEN